MRDCFMVASLMEPLSVTKRDQWRIMRAFTQSRLLKTATGPDGKMLRGKNRVAYSEEELEWVSKEGYSGVDGFVKGLGTVRECVDCSALIAGGPTRCLRCVKEGPPKAPWLTRMYKHCKGYLPMRRGGLYMIVGYLERLLVMINRNEEMAPDTRYATYVALHKLYVYQAGRKLGLPRLQLILHDLHKLTPTEWEPYVSTFYREGVDAKDAFDYAWLHHQKTMGKHHWQYFVLPLDDGSVRPLEMPEKYATEMVADWMGAGKAITGGDDLLPWYRANRDRMTLHPSTRWFVEDLIGFDYRAEGFDQ